MLQYAKIAMEQIKKMIKKIKRLRLQKMHLDYIAGLLSIPVLLTAIIINFTNLNKGKSQEPVATPTPQIIEVPQTQKPTAPTTSDNQQVCKKTIGPIAITYPQEGQNVSDNPVCITIDYSDTDYCSVVWSYRINNGSWSDYNNNAPCLYNLPNGNVTFQLRVNSTVSSDTKTLTRDFTYNGSTVVTPEVTPTAALTPTPTQSGPTPVASSSAKTE